MPTTPPVLRDKITRVLANKNATVREVADCIAGVLNEINDHLEEMRQKQFRVSTGTLIYVNLLSRDAKAVLRRLVK